MKSVLLSAVAAFTSLWIASAASATTVAVTYTGVITSGYDLTGVWWNAGSLVGDTAIVSLAYDLSQGIYSADENSSSFVSFGPASGAGPVQASIFIAGGGGTGFSNSPNGVAVDQATLGYTNQSISLVLPQYSESLSIIASASDPRIPASIMQSFTLKDIDLAVAFSLTKTPDQTCPAQALPCIINVFGSITHGDLGVVFTPAATATTPLPAALPLFAAGLGALGLVGWRRRRKSSALA